MGNANLVFSCLHSRGSDDPGR